MKLRLDDSEKEQLVFLSDLGTGVHKVTLDTLGFSEFWQVKFFIEETCALLKLHKFAEFKPFTFCKEKKCFIEDIFLKTYRELVLNGKEDEAKELALKCNAEVLNLVVEGKLTIDNFMEFHGTKINFFSGGHLDYDMIDFLVLQIEIKQELIDYVNEYIIPTMPKKQETAEGLYAQNPTIFDKEESYLQVNHKRCPILKYSKQYDFLGVVFSELDKDWQFSEISEVLEFAESYNWKKFHNIALALNSKVASKLHLDDFFMTTSQSVRINPIYLKKQSPSSINDTLDDF